ncbi:hypothetical protein QBC36DRAFT_356048 [Triangularia setosa]|uniref:Uncharacterized protein n=1 Tax=Triangularia setosa TaxID=2587417 RepID=A0AAN6W5Y8_9PEZI|nr:hypothetical protein QBC36DRAFT_356048 [Podospora setosa]
MKSTKRQAQEMSDDTPPLTSRSGSPPSIIEAPDTPRDGFDGPPAVASSPSPRQTLQQQIQGQSQISGRPAKRQKVTNTHRKCRRCPSVFEMRPPVPRGIAVPNIPQSTWNERTNLFCARCFMLLYVCETMFATNKLEARCKPFDEVHTDNCQNWDEVMGNVHFLNQLFVAGGNDIIKAAQNPKTKELFENEGEIRPWSRILWNLDKVLNGRPKDEAEVRLLGQLWRSEVHKWIGMAAMMLLHTFFDQRQQKNLDWRCGGYCGHCKPKKEDHKARMAMQRAILRGDQELPGQPLSFTRLFEMVPRNADGIRPQYQYISNIDGRRDFGVGRNLVLPGGGERFSPWGIENNAASRVNFDDWVVNYDRYKGYDQALQDNIDNFSALDNEP